MYLLRKISPNFRLLSGIMSAIKHYPARLTNQPVSGSGTQSNARRRRATKRTKRLQRLVSRSDRPPSERDRTKHHHYEAVRIKDEHTVRVSPSRSP